MTIRAYDPTTDAAQAERVWRECGWIDSDDEAAMLPHFLADAHALVAVPDDEVECLVSIHDGTMDHTGSDLPLAAVSSVTTSRTGRRQGLAQRTLAAALVAAAERGAAISALGMFEQGFYDLLGFGTGAEVLVHRFDPAELRGDLPYRTPVRLTVDDHAAITAALLRRDRAHGAVTLPSPSMRRAELGWTENGFGLGYRDRDGDVTHFVWCSAKGEHGPYTVQQWAWRNGEQLLELLGVLRSLGDQVRTVVVPEPAQLQLQPLRRRIGRDAITRAEGDHRSGTRASAWWQARVLDLPRCTRAVRSVTPVRFSVSVTDPLQPATGFDAVAGDWTLELTPEGSRAVRGSDPGLPTMHTSVNELTRMLLGVRAPSVLAPAGALTASPGLLAALDDALRLPRPDVSMDF